MPVSPHTERNEWTLKGAKSADGRPRLLKSVKAPTAEASWAMTEARTTAAVHHHRDEWGGMRGDAPGQPIVRAWLDRLKNTKKLK